ncbi:hypothetical protein PSENEW3_00000191 [Picochlorum sp. SENEW3]|nr:hypothetical protein PSENEW3_00000191 [Picochlorum sp. SENEW3]
MKYPLPEISTEPGMTTALRSAKQMWPFVAGFALTGYLILKVSSGITDEDVKKSKFANPKGAHH